MAENFKVFIRVRYAECDAQGVVFNARYADYVDVAATEYLRVLFGGYQSLLGRGIDNQVVRLGIDWTAPARFDDILEIDIETAHIGNSSYAFKLGFREYSSRRQLAVAEIVYVMVTPIEYRKQSIPDSFRKALQEGAKDKRVDFSGAHIPVC
jgi:acyl-CoA thioester hydrolase